MEDGWIEWAGGECPLTSPRVEVRYRDGDTVNLPVSEMMDEGSWQHEATDPNGDIIAYRIIPQ